MASFALLIRFEIQSRDDIYYFQSIVMPQLEKWDLRLDGHLQGTRIYEVEYSMAVKH